jgi:N-methylhydantoinase A
MRHKGQINEVEVMLDWRRAGSKFEAPLRDAFYRRYEQLYGRGASFRGARIEIVTFRLRAMADMPRPRLVAAEHMTDAIPAGARRPSRAVYWSAAQAAIETPIYDGTALLPGNSIAGPTVVETPDTTVVVHPGQRLTIDAFGNFELEFGPQ